MEQLTRTSTSLEPVDHSEEDYAMLKAELTGEILRLKAESTASEEAYAREVRILKEELVQSEIQLEEQVKQNLRIIEMRGGDGGEGSGSQVEALQAEILSLKEKQSKEILRLKQEILEQEQEVKSKRNSTSPPRNPNPP